MSDTLKNKMLGYETVPPPSVWNRISEQLDNEYHSSDATISSKLENTTIAAPAGAWNNIAAGLHEEEPVSNQAKVIPIFYKRIAVAVILAAVVAVSVMYLLTGSGNNPSFVNNSVNQNGSSSKYKPALSASKESVPSPASVIAQPPQVHLLPAQQLAYRRSDAVSENALVQDAAENDGSSEYNYLPQAQPDVQTVQALNPVNIPAPLIRDASGHVIMDMKLITNGADHFITVTSPNGTQTKISSKFLPCLSYLNGNAQSGQLDDEGTECSEKFAAWRDKLLSQGEYVPAANNFFDIFELQDLLQD